MCVPCRAEEGSMRTLSCLAVILFTVAPAWSHHGAGTFELTKSVSFTGTLTRIELINPHSWIYFEVKEPDGKVTNWGIEAGSPTTLLRRGLRKTDFSTGTEVIVEGYRSKSGAPRANGKTLTFADGRNFFLGASDNPASEGAK